MSYDGYGLQFGFDIDDGQLDGFSPQECFVLGFELGDITRRFQNGDKFQVPVHAANADRIRKASRIYGADIQLDWMSDDVSESWLWLIANPTQKGSET